MGLIDVESVTKVFGGVRALWDISFSVNDGEMFAVIGPNGAGKTTLFNVITGYERPTSGRVRFLGTTLTGLKPYQIAGMGIGRTFQGISLFENLTVVQTLMTGLFTQRNYGLRDAVFRTARYHEEEKRARQAAERILEFIGMGKLADSLVRSLPYGLQKRLEIGKALVCSPRVILLDEPAAGLNPEESRDLAQLIRNIRDRLGVTVMLIEHHMELVMSICDRVLVLNYGEKIAEGLPSEVQKHEAVIEAYLGKGEDEVA